MLYFANWLARMISKTEGIPLELVTIFILSFPINCKQTESSNASFFTSYPSPVHNTSHIIDN